MDNLTRDALAAEKAGMSYGKWKALHPHTKPKNKKAPKEDDGKLYRHCKICGARFEVKYPNHFMCSDECRVIHERYYNREFQRRLREKRVNNMEG